MRACVHAHVLCVCVKEMLTESGIDLCYITGNSFKSWSLTCFIQSVLDEFLTITKSCKYEQWPRGKMVEDILTNLSVDRGNLILLQQRVLLFRLLWLLLPPSVVDGRSRNPLYYYYCARSLQGYQTLTWQTHVVPIFIFQGMVSVNDDRSCSITITSRNKITVLVLNIMGIWENFGVKTKKYI